MTRTRTLLAGALLGAALFFTRAGRADEAERKALFEEATALMRDGNYAEAAGRLRKVIAIRSAPNAVIALAAAEEKQGHLLEAKRLLEQAGTDAFQQKLPDAERLAAEGLRNMRHRIPTVVPHVDAPGELHVRVDGKPVLVRGVEVEVDPGRREIELRVDGYEPYRTTVTVKESEHVDVRAELVKQPDQPRPTPVKPAPTGGAPIGPIVLTGAGALFMGGAVALWVAGRNQEQIVIDACNGKTTRCDPNLQPLQEEAYTELVAGNVLAGVGAAAMVGGVVWWIVRAATKPAEATATLAPTRTGAKLVWRASF